MAAKKRRELRRLENYQVNLEEMARDIGKKEAAAISNLERSNKGKYAETTGVSDVTLARLNVR